MQTSKLLQSPGIISSLCEYSYVDVFPFIFLKRYLRFPSMYSYLRSSSPRTSAAALSFSCTSSVPSHLFLSSGHCSGCPFRSVVLLPLLFAKEPSVPRCYRSILAPEAQQEGGCVPVRCGIDISIHVEPYLDLVRTGIGRCNGCHPSRP